MSVTVHAPNSSAIARVFDPKRTLKALIKATNMTGIDLRKEIPTILAEEVQTSRAALKPKAKAAHSSQRDPAYTLRIARRIPLNRLKPAARLFKRRRGKSGGRLILRQADGSRDVFNAFALGKGRNRRLKLVETSSLPERLIGGPVISSKFRNTPRARQRVDRVPRDLAGAFEEAFAAELGRALKR